MYLAFHSVHAPIQVPFKYLEMYNHLNETKSETRRKMMAMVTALDDNVGKIVQHLKKRDLFDNTIFLFTSDVSFFTITCTGCKEKNGHPHILW